MSEINHNIMSEGETRTAKISGPAVADYVSDLGAGAVLALVATGRAKSRSELLETLGWSRATVTQRLAFLLSSGLLEEAAETLPSGGRPSRILRMNVGFGVVLAADVGERSLRLAVTDLLPRVLAETTLDMDVGRGPAAVLAAIAQAFDTLLDGVGRGPEEVVGIGLSLPAPVDFAAGRVVGPSVMRGWDDFDIRGWMRHRFDAPTLVENDVNVMTLAEARRFWPDASQFFYVKVGTGIGSGIVADGRIYRGAQGAAGDIGHIQMPGTAGPLCRCGKLGCVEASASGWSMARDLRAIGLEARDARGVLALVEANQPNAINLVRAAGRIVGEVAASVVSVLNPSVIVVGGTLSRAGDHLLSGIRELIYQRCLPLATRDLVVVAARSGDDANIIGAATLVLESSMSPGAVDRRKAPPPPGPPGRHPQRGAAAPVLSSVPNVLERGRRVSRDLAREVLNRPFSPFAEAIREIRVLFTTMEDGPAQVIGFISAVPGEGKSTVSMNLGHLLAKSRTKTLIIDGDLRNPMLSKAIGSAPTRGLAEVLRNQARLGEVMLKDADTGLDILPVAITEERMDVGDLLASNEMKQLVQKLRQVYQIILIDLPPLLVVSDAKASAGLFDGFIMVTEWGKTQADEVARALQNSDRLRNRLFGVVLNKVDTRAAGGHRDYDVSGYLELEKA